MVWEVTMTIRETVDIIRESSLWETLTITEKAEVLAHVIETARGATNRSILAEDFAEQTIEFFRN